MVSRVQCCGVLYLAAWLRRGPVRLGTGGVTSPHSRTVRLACRVSSHGDIAAGTCMD
jgi:hypothetical protein